jgi:hypothetical protein
VEQHRPPSRWLDPGAVWRPFCHLDRLKGLFAIIIASLLVAGPIAAIFRLDYPLALLSDFATFAVVGAIATVALGIVLRRRTRRTST